MITFLKFIHVLFAMSLLGITVYRFALVGSTNHQKMILLNKMLILLTIFALVSGTFLVYPSGFTFQTPWIQAAYLLLFIFFLGVGILATFKSKWVQQFTYFILVALLVLAIHDAVTKSTLFL